MKLTESWEFWVLGQLLPGFSPQWQAPLSLRLATGLVLCGVRHWARREGGTPVAWRPGHCFSGPSPGARLWRGSAQPGSERLSGVPFRDGHGAFRGNLGSVSSSCPGLSCPRPCCRVRRVARPQCCSGHPGRILPHPS